jgi:hypothetical protein
MPRSDFRSDRHAALDAVYPPDKRYCACKQGRRQDCRCAYREDDLRPQVVAVIIVIALISLAFFAVNILENFTK